MIRALALACHPGPTVAVTLLAVLLGLGVGLGAGDVVLLGAAVSTGQLAIGWTNDAVDAERDRVAGRRDKPAARGAVSVGVLRAAVAVALPATLVLSFLLGWRAALAALTLVAAGIAYDLGLKATWWSGAAYAVGFGALPCAPYLALPGHPAPPWWAPVTGALLGLAAHVGNVLPDLDDDIAAGVRGLPHRIGVGPSRALLGVALVGAGLAAVVGSSSLARPVAVAGLVVVVLGSAAALATAVRRPSSVVTFYLVVVVALVDVVLFVLAA
ncbi:UbiA family prenyltransferase [Jatrophihabitans sp. YIM 134969]